MDYPIDTEALAEFAATSEPTREQMCEDLARAMGWTRQECLLHSMSRTCWTSSDKSVKHQVWPPNPFDSADDSRALVAWLAEDDEQWNKFCFQFRINVSVPAILMTYQDHDGELIPDLAAFAKRLMTTPLPVIAEAAWRAIQEKQ